MRASATKELLDATVSLVRAALNGEGILPRAELLSAIAAFARRHDIMPLVSAGLRRLNAPFTDEQMKPFHDAELVAVCRYQRLQYEYAQLTTLFEEACIPHIPLKGTVLRDYYPEPWYRTSCDIDVLVKEEDLRRAAELLCEKGYTICKWGNHDVAINSPSGVHVEVHFCLSESPRDKDSVYDRVWENAAPTEGKLYECRMTREFFYYHHVKHNLKHFINGGGTVRSFVDHYYLRALISLEQNEALRSILSEGGALRFAEGCERLCSVWFCGMEQDETTELLEDFLLTSGLYNGRKNSLAIKETKRGGKAWQIFLRICPPYSTLSVYYPFLKKCPILYPFYLVRRWFARFFKGGIRRPVQVISEYMSITKDDVFVAKRLFELLGVEIK